MENDLLVLLDIEDGKHQPLALKYAEQNDEATLTKASKLISHFIWRDFKASQIFIIEYKSLVSGKIAELRAALASDSVDTYAILYIRVPTHYANFGYSSQNCSWNILQERDTFSNTGYSWTNIIKVSDGKCFHDCKFQNKFYFKSQFSLDLSFRQFLNTTISFFIDYF